MKLKQEGWLFLFCFFCFLVGEGGVEVALKQADDVICGWRASKLVS